MSEARRTPWWRRRWATVGEVVGVAALVIAALGYWDAHRERGAERAEKTAAARREAARESLVLTASVQADGARLLLSPLRPGQAIQSQRYRFPRAVSERVMEVSAAQPQIDRAWFEGGLKSALEAAAQARGDKLAEGEGSLPVAVATSYIEDGDTRSDASLYRIGYRLSAGGLFGGRKVTLQGLSLLRRGVGADPQAAVDASWRATSAHALASDAG